MVYEGILANLTDENVEAIRESVSNSRGYSLNGGEIVCGITGETIGVFEKDLYGGGNEGSFSLISKESLRGPLQVARSGLIRLVTEALED